MKYLGEEKRVEVKTVVERKIEYIRCDKCNKKILPYRYNNGQGQYVHIHTWHSDWGNDSIESHEYHDYCPECAKKVISEYIDEMYGSEELELSHKYLSTNEIYRGKVTACTDGYALVERDKED